MLIKQFQLSEDPWRNLNHPLRSSHYTFNGFNPSLIDRPNWTSLGSTKLTAKNPINHSIKQIQTNPWSFNLSCTLPLLINASNYSLKTMLLPCRMNAFDGEGKVHTFFSFEKDQCANEEKSWDADKVKRELNTERTETQLK